MKKRFYIILLSALCLSALLLGFSYAKESGTNQDSFLNQDKNDSLKIVYSDYKLSTTDEDGTDISVVNRGDREAAVILTVEKDESASSKKYDVYYSINNQDIKKLTDSEIILGTLKNYGTEGDQATYNIKITSKSEEPIYYKMSIKKEARKTIGETINGTDNTYKDEANNIRYYGPNVNNYIRYNSQTYRIIGLFGNSVRLVSNVTEESNYGEAANHNLVTLEDYLMSFADYRIPEESANSLGSWLKEQQFWLADKKDNRPYVASAKLGIYTDSESRSHNNRYVEEISSNTYILSGDGTINNPYEVSYGS